MPHSTPVSGAQTMIHSTTAGAAAAPHRPTDVRTIEPFAGGADATVTSYAQATGSCFTESLAVQNDPALRCISNTDRILDPCFVPPKVSSPARVVCETGAAPDLTVTVLTVTKPLPALRTPTVNSDPWTFSLDNGTTCVRRTGTIPTIDGVPSPYSCSGSSGATAPDRSRLVWTTTHLTASNRSTVPVAIAWYG